MCVAPLVHRSSGAQPTLVATRLRLCAGRRPCGPLDVGPALMVNCMRGASDEFSVGIAFYRAHMGLTQNVLAGLVDRSEDWLSKIERGEHQIRRLDVATEVAKALRSP